MNEMSEMNLRRVNVSPYESEWECPYQTECEMSISESPYQIVHIKMSISKYQFYLSMIQIVVLLELGWASIQQPIIKSIILIDLNEHLKNLEDSLDRHRAWRHTKVI